MSALDDSLRIFDAGNAERYAAELFRECFGAPFPVPREGCGLPIPTPAQNWRQYVAIYRWPDGREETVGFCNWIRHGDAYLAGGLCVDERFYRRLPRADFAECRRRGGVAQIILEVSRRALTDAKALFGYVGDSRSMAVSLRCGYQRTEHPHLIVNWVQDPGAEEKAHLIRTVAAIGPF